MISFFPRPPEGPAEGPGEGASIASLRARLATMMPVEPVNAASREVGLLLLAAVSLGQNIDRLARFTGVRRDVVARCARRLVDNGVWQDGHTVCRWVDTPDDIESFWADVAVAEGRLCRRVGEDGELEWAAQGYWRKHYDYVGPRGAEQPQTISYHPHVEPGSQDLPYVADEEEEEEEDVAEEVRPQREERRALPELFPAAEEKPVWLGGDVAEPAPAAAPWSDEPEPADALFPDAVWLG